MKSLFAYIGIIFSITSVFAQPSRFKFHAYSETQFINTILHPQSDITKSIMKKSKEKTLYAIDTDNSTYYDTVQIRKYDKKGRLVYSLNDEKLKLRKYKYDRKNRVVEYYESDYEFVQLHLCIKYARNGSIDNIVSLDTNKFGTKISFDKQTQTLRLDYQKRGNENHYYKYTLNKYLRLESVESKYYNTVPFRAKVYYNNKGKVIREEGKLELEIDHIEFTKSYFYSENELIKTEERTKSLWMGHSLGKTLVRYVYNNSLLQKKEGSTNTHVFTYDKKNRIKSATFTINKSGGVTKYTYLYK